MGEYFMVSCHIHRLAWNMSLSVISHSLISTVIEVIEVVMFRRTVYRFFIWQCLLQYIHPRQSQSQPNAYVCCHKLINVMLGKINSDSDQCFSNYS